MHEYPLIGAPIAGAVSVLQQLVRHGHQLILWTIRSGEKLDEAADWFAENGIALWSVNCNPNQHTWSQSPKAYAHLFIDDAAFGAPLVCPEDARPYLDWTVVASKLLT